MPGRNSQNKTYYLVNGLCPPNKLKDIISEALLHLESMELNVVSVISDQGSNFLSLVNDLGVSSQQPYFEMIGRKYFVIFDPPHLLKSVRNNLIKYRFEFEGKQANWDHIKSFYQKEQKIP